VTSSRRSRPPRGVSGERVSQAPPVPAATTGAITRYVQMLGQVSDLPKPIFEAAWSALRQMLREELRARSLWDSPPSYVGVYGCTSWGDRNCRPESSGGPLEELLQDCFSFVLLERLPQHQARLKVNDDIDGDVRLYVRNFVHIRQKDHDPLGSRLFELLRTAVDEAQEAGELFLVGGDPSIRNNTILASSRRPSMPPVEELREQTIGWAQDAVADLFSTGPNSRRRAIERLRNHLVQLEAQGVRVFLFRAALDGLKQDVRAHLAMLFEQDLGEGAMEVDEDGVREWVRKLQPATWVEEIDHYRKLVACVTELVDRYEGREKTRRYLWQLWGLLRRFVASVEDRFPAHRQIAKLLGIPRARIPELLEILGGYVRRCSAKNSAIVVAGSFVAPEPGGEGHD
jgi:hypothetical protein